MNNKELYFKISKQVNSDIFNVIHSQIKNPIWILFCYEFGGTQTAKQTLILMTLPVSRIRNLVFDLTQNQVGKEINRQSKTMPIL